VVTSFEIVGTNAPGAVESERLMRLVEATLRVIGADAVKEIQERLAQANFKDSKGGIQRALGWEVDGATLTVSVDERVAPYAKYQESGVRRHEMRYLLKSTRPIPVKGGPGCVVFRWAKEEDMGREHLYKDECHGGAMAMASGWVHPGYEGKHFFRDGINAVVARMPSYSKALSLRVAVGSGS